MELSDRIAVMYRGRIVSTIDGRTADKHDVGLLMATGGAAREAAVPAGVGPTTGEPGATT
jgi:ABC-type sugar transport system ATPase subunit